MTLACIEKETHMTNLNAIIDELEALTGAEKATLASMLEEAWGVKSSFVPMPSGPAPELVTAPVKDSFDVVLVGFTDKMRTIMEVRKVLGLDLKAAKDFVELAERTGSVVKGDLSRADADELARVLTAAGGKAEVR